MDLVSNSQFVDRFNRYRPAESSLVGGLVGATISHLCRQNPYIGFFVGGAAVIAAQAFSAYIDISSEASAVQKTQTVAIEVLENTSGKCSENKIQMLRNALDAIDKEISESTSKAGKALLVQQWCTKYDEDEDLAASLPVICQKKRQKYKLSISSVSHEDSLSTPAPVPTSKPVEKSLEQYRKRISSLEDTFQRWQTQDGVTEKDREDALNDLEMDLEKSYEEMHRLYAKDMTDIEKVGYTQIRVKKADLQGEWIRNVPQRLAQHQEAIAAQQSSERSIDYSYHAHPSPAAHFGKKHEQATEEFQLPCIVETKIVGEDVVVTAHAQGVREAMEDADCQEEVMISIRGKSYPLTVNGIFDGHGKDKKADPGKQTSGESAAKFFSSEFPKALSQEIHELVRMYPDFCSSQEGILTDEAMYNALHRAFIKLHYQHRIGGGSTACVEVDFQGYRWIANVGDSRALMINADQTITQLSLDAKPTDPDIKQDIMARGGRVERKRIVDKNGEPSLAVGRSLGDHLPGVNPAPNSIIKRKKEDKEVVVIGCDGVFDVAPTYIVGGHIKTKIEGKKRDLQTIAADILYSAYMQGSQDNLSIQIKRKATPEELRKFRR
jgi:serine/threonine protein phosphatase PrpC